MKNMNAAADDQMMFHKLFKSQNSSWFIGHMITWNNQLIVLLWWTHMYLTVKFTIVVPDASYTLHHTGQRVAAVFVWWNTRLRASWQVILCNFLVFWPWRMEVDGEHVHNSMIAHWWRLFLECSGSWLG